MRVNVCKNHLETALKACIYGGSLGPAQIQVRGCGNTSYSCREAS